MMWDLRGESSHGGVQHCNESIALICQKENTEVVEQVCAVGEDGEQPIDGVLINALREEQAMAPRSPRE